MKTQWVHVGIIMKCLKLHISAVWGPHMGAWTNPGSNNPGNIRPREHGQCHFSLLYSFPSQDTPNCLNRLLHVSGQVGCTSASWHPGLVGFLTNPNYLERGKSIFPLCSLKYLIKEMWGTWKLYLISRQLFISTTSLIL